MGVSAAFSPSKVVKSMVLLTAECDHDPEASVQLHSALAALPSIVTNLATPLTSVLTSGMVVDMTLPDDNGAPVVAPYVFFGVLAKVGSYYALCMRKARGHEMVKEIELGSIVDVKMSDSQLSGAALMRAQTSFNDYMVQYEPRRREVAAPVAAEPAPPQAAPAPAPEQPKLTKRDLMGMTAAKIYRLAKPQLKDAYAALDMGTFTTCAEAKLAICTELKKDPPEWAKPKKKATAPKRATRPRRAPARPRSDDESDESPPPTRKRKASDADASPPTDGAGLALEDVVQKLTADIATVREERAESEGRLLQAIADLAKKPREEGSGLGESSSQKRRGSSSSKSSRSHEGDALSSDDDARDHAGHVRRSVQAVLRAGAGNVQYNHFASGSNVTLVMGGPDCAVLGGPRRAPAIHGDGYGGPRPPPRPALGYDPSHGY